MTADEVWIYCKRKHYSAAYTSFWQENMWCEVCRRPSVAPHHIRTRGAGGDDAPENLMALCTEHHTGPAGIHVMGRQAFCERHPVIMAKVAAAMERSRV